MKRKDALIALRIAGAENDSKEFVRVYTENRISYKLAIDQFRIGAEMAKNGMKIYE